MKGWKGTVLCVVCALTFAVTAKADYGVKPLATLPPGLPASVTAPRVDLPVRLFPFEARARSLTQGAFAGEAIAVSGSVAAGLFGRADALWFVDLETSIYSLVYETRRGMQIQSPVWCEGHLYWVETYEDQPAGWRIRSWERNMGQTGLVRTDPYPESAIAPMLTVENGRVYWYESGERLSPSASSYQQIEAELFAFAPPNGEQRALMRLKTQRDWKAPCVVNGMLYAGIFDRDRWWIVAYELQGGAERMRVALDGMPIGIQSDGRYVAWRQVEENPFVESANGQQELGWQAKSEEEPDRQAQGLPGGGLWYFDFNDMSPTPRLIDTGADTLLLLPEGIYYISESRALCFYSFHLGWVFRLSGHADYLPVLYAADARGEVLAFRAIETGEQVCCRAALIDVAALRVRGWPQLD